MIENLIFAVNDRVSKLCAQGADIIALTAGEPQAETAAAIVQAAKTAVADPRNHRYGTAAGDLDLRRAIVDMLPAAIRWVPDDVLITIGAKHALTLAIQAVTRPGDEVLVIQPGWPGHAGAVTAAGANPVLVPVDPIAQLDVEVLVVAAGPRTRAVILASPANPTGVVLNPASLHAIAEWASATGIWVISDDVYASFDYSGTYTHVLDVAPHLRDQTVIISSVSKAHAMTGWRVGWLAGPNEVVRRARQYLSATVTNVPLVMQRAALAALADRDGPAAAWDAYLIRRNRLVAVLQAHPGFDCEAPDGGMFVFPSVRRLLTEFGWDSSTELVDRLIDEGVAVVPGEAFGAPDRVRICYAVDEHTLETAISRIVSALANHRKASACAH